MGLADSHTCVRMATWPQGRTTIRPYGCRLVTAVPPNGRNDFSLMLAPSLFHGHRVFLQTDVSMIQHFVQKIVRPKMLLTGFFCQTSATSYFFVAKYFSAGKLAGGIRFCPIYFQPNKCLTRFFPSAKCFSRIFLHCSRRRLRMFSNEFSQTNLSEAILSGTPLPLCRQSPVC